jgi:hypothetical protein
MLARDCARRRPQLLTQRIPRPLVDFLHRTDLRRAEAGRGLRTGALHDTVWGAVGRAFVARAKPDGYTIDLGYLGNHVLNGAVYSLQYDVLNDFAPISPLVTSTVALFARKSVPATERINRLAEG